MMHIRIQHKNVQQHLLNFQDILSKKTGKRVPMTKAIEVAFQNEWWNEFKDASVKRKRRRKNQYVIKI
jgi:hypothetical protein